MVCVRRRTLLVLGVTWALGVMSASSAVAAAVPGDLDPTFGGDGKVTTNFTRYNDAATDLAIQADGKIVAVGRASASCSRDEVAPPT
jgi:hypothetical protein